MSGEIIEKLVGNVLHTRFEDISQSTVDQAKRRIIDVTGCLLAGVNAPGCSMIAELVKKWGGSEESTILGYGYKAPAYNAAMANSILARSVDFEPLSPYINGRSVPGHICGTTVPTAITVAEQTGASGKQLITALVLGDDFAARILAASSFSFHTGWMSSGLCNAFGATAIACKLRGLSENQTLNAFGIVVNQLGGTIQAVYDGVHSFKLLQGLTGRAGVFSAELAASGFTGVKDPLLSKYGYFPLYCRDYDLEILVQNLGKEFYADSTIKPYPCCRGNHAPIECVLFMIKNNPVAVDDIASVSVKVSPVWYQFIGSPFEIGEVPQVRAIYSLPYNIANVLLRKSVKLEHFTDEFIKDPAVMALAKKVIVEAVPVPSDRPMMTDVKIKMRDGAEFAAHVDVPKGEPVLTPFTDAEIKSKFKTNVAFSKRVTKQNADRALAMMERFEELGNIQALIKLLAA